MARLNRHGVNGSEDHGVPQGDDLQASIRLELLGAVQNVISLVGVRLACVSALGGWVVYPSAHWGCHTPSYILCDCMALL